MTASSYPPISRLLGLVSIFLAPLGLAAENVAPAWLDFREKHQAGKPTESQLMDYSYAGYHFSEREIPSIPLEAIGGHRIFNVAEMGADLTDDTDFDDDGIRKAIREAENHIRQREDHSAVIYFPAGFYQVADKANEYRPFEISESRIIIKGDGSGPGGTIIHSSLSGWRELSKTKINAGPYRFHFSPSDPDGRTLAVVTDPVQRGAHTIKVDSTDSLKVGDWVVIEERTVENLPLNFGDLEFLDHWTIRNTGLECLERHQISSLDDQLVTFRNPVNMNLAAHSASTTLVEFQSIEEVGVEDIRFSSGWRDHPETFIHHKNEFVDYAYRAIQMENVRNGWIRNCVFDSWNEVINIDQSVACTLQNIQLVGKKGHASYFATRSTGILGRDLVDDVQRGGARLNQGQLHGPGILHHSSAIVFLDCKINRDQSIDNHSFGPYGNLFDNIKSGVFNASGGPQEAFPNSGPDLTLWNFRHHSSNSRKDLEIDFWSPDPGARATFAKPNLIGLTTEGSDLEMTNAGLIESEGKEVYPRSLFEAQLQRRLYGTYLEASTQAVGHPSANANDADRSTSWRSLGSGAGQWLSLDFGEKRKIKALLIDEIGQRIDVFQVEVWNGSSWSSVTTEAGGGKNRVVRFIPRETERIRVFFKSLLPGFKKSPIAITTLKAQFEETR